MLHLPPEDVINHVVLQDSKGRVPCLTHSQIATVSGCSVVGNPENIDDDDRPAHSVLEKPLFESQ